MIMSVCADGRSSERRLMISIAPSERSWVYSDYQK